VNRTPPNRTPPNRRPPAAGPPTGIPPAAQRERTRFAWRRTVLAGTAVAVLAVRQALLADPAWLRAIGTAAVMLVWLAVLVAGHRRVVQLGLGVTAPGVAPMVAAAVTVGFAVLGLALVAA
jgi:hypothetical protein